MPALCVKMGALLTGALLDDTMLGVSQVQAATLCTVSGRFTEETMQGVSKLRQCRLLNAGGA